MDKETSSPDLTSPYGNPTRHVTTHDTSTGKAIFTSSLPPAVGAYGVATTLLFDAYKTLSHPPNITNESDISAYQSHTPDDMVWFPAVGQTLVRYCDWAPGVYVPMHKTATIDFGVVLRGEVELELDSGEKRIVKEGEVVVQRGTI